MKAVRVDRLRGLIDSARSGPAVLDIVPVVGGFELHCGDRSLESARGGVRQFKTLDAIYKYVTDHLFSDTVDIELRLRVRSGTLL